jgi:hypothetical protein
MFEAVVDVDAYACPAQELRGIRDALARWAQDSATVEDELPRTNHYGQVYVGELSLAPGYLGFSPAVDCSSARPVLSRLVPLAASVSVLSRIADDDAKRRFLTVPSRQLLARLELHWDGAGGFLTRDGRRVFWDPSFPVGERGSLVGDGEDLSKALDEEGLALVWVAWFSKEVRTFDRTWQRRVRTRLIVATQPNNAFTFEHWITKA